jgi:predicted membrane protein (TIGR00267 family)
MTEKLSERIPVRYTVLGTIDGVIACLAVVLGVFSAAPNVKIIVIGGLSGGIGLGLSNGIGGFLAERTVEHKRLRELERSMLLKQGAMEHTVLTRAIRVKLFYDTITHGCCSFLGAMVPILPFLIGLHVNFAIIFSIIVSLIVLFVLGMYMGLMTKENIILMGSKMMIIGLVVAVVVRLIGVH